MLSTNSIILVGVLCGVAAINIVVGLVFFTISRRRRVRARAAVAALGPHENIDLTPPPHRRKSSYQSSQNADTASPQSFLQLVMTAQATQARNRESAKAARRQSSGRSGSAKHGEAPPSRHPQRPHRGSQQALKKPPMLSGQMSVRSYDTESIYSSSSAPLDEHENAMARLPPIRSSRTMEFSVPAHDGRTINVAAEDSRAYQGENGPRLAAISEELSPEIWTGRVYTSPSNRRISRVPVPPIDEPELARLSSDQRTSTSSASRRSTSLQGEHLPPVPMRSPLRNPS